MLEYFEKMLLNIFMKIFENINDTFQKNVGSNVFFPTNVGATPFGKMLVKLFMKNVGQHFV
jgi:hypothetical protein